MSKFRIKFKLQGLELEVEGSREDVPVIREALSQQLAGVLTPATDIAGGEPKNITPVTRVGLPEAPAVRKSRRSRSSGGSGTNAGTEQALDWRHEPDKFGSPIQKWPTAKKALWLIYVIAAVFPGKELSAAGLAATFRKHFKQFGPIQGGHTARDLGKLKAATKDYPMALVIEDTTREPTTWSLSEAGSRIAQSLVAEAKGSPTAAEA